MERYGKLHKRRGKDPIWGAAMGGNFDSSPEEMLQLMMESLTERKLPPLHVVHSFELEDGSVVPGIAEEVREPTTKIRNKKLLRQILTAPIESNRGTLHEQKGSFQYGKTGTVGGKGKTSDTNMSLSIGATETDIKDQDEPAVHATIAVIAADKTYEKRKLIAINKPGQNANGGRIAGPVVGKLMNTIQERVKEGNLR